MKFSVVGTEGHARAGVLTTDHGIVETPRFMPVGTQGSVKAIEQRELKEIGASLILGNTYHLYLRPGTDVIQDAGGLHRFAAWPDSILTDSGGYQVFSLTDLRRIEERGVEFRSHIDGSSHFFSPESVITIQRVLGSDIMMVLDECTPYPCDHEYALASNELTLRWARRCKEEFERTAPLYGHGQALFGIVQGSVHEDIRDESARSLAGMDFDGYALGGLAVGEPEEMMYAVIDRCEPLLPSGKPRYLMGVGTPANLLEAVARGMDMFDCVLPTRNGRNAMMFTRNGSLNLRNAQYKMDHAPVDPDCTCYACRTVSRSYLRHLFLAKEILGLQLATIHNLSFYHWLMTESRKAIIEGRFASWKQEQLKRWSLNVSTEVSH